MNSDGVNEIIGFIMWNRGFSPEVTDSGVIISDGRGNVKHRYVNPTSFDILGIANLDGQGNPEIIATNDEYSIRVFDSNLLLLCEKQLPRGKKGAIADLYGDGMPEIILLLPNQLMVLSYRPEEKKLEELWSFSDFETQSVKEDSPILIELLSLDSVILSDILPGGSVELIISADKIYILGADIDSTGRDRDRWTGQGPSTMGRDRGWRYIDTYDLARTNFYPHAPQSPLPEEEPFVLKKIIETKDAIQVNFTGDVNGDGALELIGVVGNKIVVLSPDGKLIWERSYRTERYFSVTALEDVFGTDSLEILANVFREGHSHILIIDGSNGAIIRDFPTEAGVTDKLHDNLVYDIEADGEGNLWFATSRDVSRFDGVSWTHVRSSPVENPDEDGEGQPVKVFALASDESYNIWAGTSSGLYRFESRWKVYSPLPNNATPVAFQIDDEGDVWVATKGAGIFRGEPNQLDPYLLDWEAHQVYSILVDRKRGYIWGSSWTLGVDRGLFKIELKTDAAEKIKDERLLNNAITAMALDSNDGSLWLGGKYGLNLYNPDTGEWRSWTHEEHPDFLPNPDEKVDDNITALYLAHDGRLWIGSKNSGVAYYDQKTDTWEKFTEVDGLSIKQINAISEDKSGGIWIATMKGASRLGPEMGKWRRFTMRDGLAGDRVYDLKVAGSNVWLATEGGVSKFDGTRWRVYDMRDGLPGNTVYTLAIEPSGTLWGGFRGGKVAVRRVESIPPDTEISKGNEARIRELFSLFNGETVSVASRRLTLPKFDEVAPRIIEGEEFDLIARKNSQHWVVEIKSGNVTAKDVNHYAGKLGKLPFHTDERILICLRGIENQALYVVQQEGIWVWGLSDVNLLMKLFGRFRIVQ